jgi:hypothetical protein
MGHKSRVLIEDAVSRALDPNGEGLLVFTQINAERAIRDAEQEPI